MNLQDLDFYIEKSLEWIKYLQAMQNDKMFNSIYVWLSKEIGETTILLNLLKRIRANEIAAKKKDKKNENNSL
jgi:hypothetical protein